MLEIEKEKIIALSKIIIDAEKKGIKDANREYEDFIKEISVEPFDKNSIYEHLLNWKVNYLKDLNSDYHLIDHLRRNNLFYRFLKGSEQEKFAAAALFFYDYHYKGTSITQDNFISLINKKIKESIQKLTLYNFCIDIIYYVNNKDNGSLKLPLIEEFEISLFKGLENEILDLKEELKINLKKYNNLENDFFAKMKEQSITNKKLTKVGNELEKTKRELSNNNNYMESVRRFIGYMENVPINQFDELYWGDNYPALKVLFNFFQKHKMIEIPWSLFANYMSIGNTNFINLNSSIFGKNDMGYLLNSIKPFFKKEFRVKKEIYNAWLVTKIFIDNKELKMKDNEKFVRNFSTTRSNLKNEKIINHLIEQIQSRYI